MMKAKVQSTDVEILLKAYFPKDIQLFIFDPSQIMDWNDGAFKDYNNCSFEAPKVLVNFGRRTAYCNGYNLNEFDYILDFGKCRKNQLRKTSFNSLNNPDGSLRWLFPKSLKRPTFLSLYNSDSLKAKILCLLLPILYVLGLKSLFSHRSIHIYHRFPLKIHQAFKGIHFENHSLFTGTPGPNRKLVFELNNHFKTTHFIKVPLNRDSLNLIQREKRMLRKLKSLDLKHVEIPKLLQLEEENIQVIENNQNTSKVSGNWTKAHTDFLAEVYEKSTVLDKVEYSFFYEIIQTNLLNLERNGTKLDKLKSLIPQLRELFDQLPKYKQVPLGIAHKDFTPWNILNTPNGLYVYDWEFGSSQTPLLFDFFHFHFQSEIMQGNKDFHSIKSKMDQELNQAEIQNLIEKHDIDVALHLELYMLYQIGYYGVLYSRQIECHEQVFWQLEVWSQALEELIKGKVPNQKQQFIYELCNAVHDTRYAWLKHAGISIHNFPENSDIDLAVLLEDGEGIIRLCENSPYVQRVLVSRKSYMKKVELFFKEGSYLSLDLIHEFKRKSQRMMDIKPLLRSVTRNEEGILIPDVRFDMEYMMCFYNLNNAHIPSKYCHWFGRQSFSDKERTNNYLMSKYRLNLKELNQILSGESKGSLNSLRMNLDWKERFSGYINYAADTIKSIWKSEGMLITFSGVDGAGKSTVLENLKEKLQSKYRKEVVVLRHRPSILPILSAWKYGKDKAEKMAVSTLPRTGNNNSLLSSVLRYTYYLADYIIGQWAVRFKYLSRGKIVLYDRYYFDFIVDGKRSNLDLPNWFTKMAYRFIDKPKLNFFLYAKPQVILERKQELDEQSIIHLTSKYQNLFLDLSKKEDATYISIENVDLNRTLNKLERQYAEAA
ncbi:MAG: hypothetical protein MRY83_05155 [Flavobacteriales bacterium]|nr:hypothetical protein [Flavobacteriales bacterium]